MSSNIVLMNVPNSQNAQGIFDSRAAYRPLDMWGDIQKWTIDGPGAKDDTTAIPQDFVVTQTGTSPLTWSVLQGSALLFTTGGTDFNGINAQVNGSQFQLASGKPVYFGVKCTLSEATQSDFLVGLCGVDTTLTAASSAHALAVSAGGVFFSKLDAVTQTTFQSWATNAVTNTANVATMDTAAHIYEIYWDGTSLFAYLDGVLAATYTSGLPTVVLTPSFVVRAGDGNARTLTVNWARAFQVLA
jgi:hypothetical protein